MDTGHTLQSRELLAEAVDILGRLNPAALHLVVFTLRPLKGDTEATTPAGEAAGIVAALPPKAQTAAVEELRTFAALLGVKLPSQNRLRLVGTK